VTHPWFYAALTSYVCSELPSLPSLYSGEVVAFRYAREWERALSCLGQSLAWAGFGAAMEKRGVTSMAEYFEDMQRRADAIGNQNIRWPETAGWHVRGLLSGWVP
jgi:hypothetical protein